MVPPMLKSQLQNGGSGFQLIFSWQKKKLKKGGGAHSRQWKNTPALAILKSDHCAVESKLIKQVSLT